jgi:hypothetical protein
MVLQNDNFIVQDHAIQHIDDGQHLLIAST